MEKAPSDIPQACGVYTFWQKGKPIYIGKAINLKSRISSYFQLNLLPKTKMMVADADKLTLTKVNSEFEALLLEAKLIRMNMPKYNSVSKDDKNPLYITITKEEFPRVITTRKAGSFGPFPSSRNVRQVLKMIRRIIPYSDHKKGKRPCLYSQIGLCSPCPSAVKTISERNIYKRNIVNIKRLLNGGISLVRNSLFKQMDNYSKLNKFEEAALVRDKIKNLEYITQKRIPIESYLQNPNLLEDQYTLELEHLREILRSLGIKTDKLKRIECFDVSHLAGTFPTASMVVFTNGEEDKSQYRHFRIRQKKSGSDFDSIKEVSRRRLKNKWKKPNLIIVDGGMSQIKAFKSDVAVVGIAKNPDRLIANNQKIRLKGPALNLVQRMRNEAHRFARRYHHHLLSINLSNENGS